MVARSLVVSAVGKISSVAFNNGYIVVSLGDMVVRHKVGARGGIPVAASRDLWRYLVSLHRVGMPVELRGRPGWAGWFDEVDVSFEYLREVERAADAREYAMAEESALEERATENGLYYDGERYCALPA
jgi:hypothetical protein